MFNLMKVHNNVSVFIILHVMMLFYACGGGGGGGAYAPSSTYIQDPNEAIYSYQLSRVERTRGDTTMMALEEYEYDANGTLTKMTTTYYENDGITVDSTKVEVYMKNSIGLISEVRKNTSTGLLLATCSYDEYNRIAKVEGYNDNTGTLEYKIITTYDAAGNSSIKVTDAAGNVTEKMIDVKDANGFLIQSTEWSSADNGVNWTQVDYREFVNHADGRVNYFNIYEGPSFDNTDTLSEKREFIYVAGDLSYASYVVIDFN